MTTINFNDIPLQVPLVEDITKKMPTSFEDFVQQEQKRIQEENALRGAGGDAPGSSANVTSKLVCTATEKNAKRMKKDKQAKTKQAIAAAIALTSRAAEKNTSNSVLPGGATATEDEIDAAMRQQKDLPIGNTKEERKKRRLVRNRVSAQLHRERKKKYISALETKVKEQNEQLLHLGKIIQTMNMQLQHLQNAANKNLCPSCASSGSDSSIPFSNSDTGSSCNSSPLLGDESDDLDYDRATASTSSSGLKPADVKIATSVSDAKWVASTAQTSTQETPMVREQKIQETTIACSCNLNRVSRVPTSTEKGKFELMDENAEALGNSSYEDLQMYADVLLNPVALDDGQSNEIKDAQTEALRLERKPSFDTSFLFDNDVDSFRDEFDNELIDCCNTASIVSALDVDLTNAQEDVPQQQDGEKPRKKRKRNNGAPAMLFGIFFACAFFGSYIGVVPHSGALTSVPSRTAAKSMPLLGNGGTKFLQSASTNNEISSRRRRRRLLSSDVTTNESEVNSAQIMKKINSDEKAIALWQNILHDMKSSPPAKYPLAGNSDVKQLLLKIGNFTHSYESSKGTSSPGVMLRKKRSLRAGDNKVISESLMGSESNRTLVRYNENGGKYDMNLKSAYTRGVLNTNASFMLCPKPYGTLAHTDAQKASVPSSMYRADGNSNEHFDQVPNTFIYDDIKVNRELILLMPSTSLGGKTGPETSQQWDGQWVQVDAIVRGVRPAVGLSGFKAIAGSQ